jgi:hypothetical protein
MMRAMLWVDVAMLKDVAMRRWQVQDLSRPDPKRSSLKSLIRR